MDVLLVGGERLGRGGRRPQLWGFSWIKGNRRRRVLDGGSFALLVIDDAGPLLAGVWVSGLVRK
jgi:hypothetical protein